LSGFTSVISEIEIEELGIDVQTSAHTILVTLLRSRNIEPNNSSHDGRSLRCG